MKIRIIITCELDVELANYPEAETPEDVIRLQQEYIDDGSSAVEDFLFGLTDTKVELA